MQGIYGKRYAKRAEKPVNIAAHLDGLRRCLEEKRSEMLELYEHDVRVGKESGDENFDDVVDRANNSFNRELMFLLSDNERQVLLRIEEAFERLDRGNYGNCTYCSGTISLARLRALPWARFCIDCQESEERGALEE
ncbi:MAG: TraR/DksA family transcriptional regulator [bacterium]|nr:TraR/DksA family transcriptional regulator [bacterium]